MNTIWTPIALSALVVAGIFVIRNKEHEGSFGPTPGSKPNPVIGQSVRAGDQAVLRFSPPTDLRELGLSEYTTAIYLDVQAADARNLSGPIVAYTTEGSGRGEHILGVLAAANKPMNEVGDALDAIPEAESAGTKFLPNGPSITMSRSYIASVYRQGRKIA